MSIDGQEVVVEGKKKKEPRFKGNKWPKSYLEVKKKPLCGKKRSSLSQPIFEDEKQHTKWNNTRTDEEESLDSLRFFR